MDRIGVWAIKVLMRLCIVMYRTYVFCRRILRSVGKTYQNMGTTTGDASTGKQDSPLAVEVSDQDHSFIFPISATQVKIFV